MQAIDTLIHARWIVPVEPEGRVLERHSLAVDRGRIVAVLDHRDATARYQPKETIDLPEHVLIPGLVNAHTHTAMSLFRGLADDLPLMDWLQKHMWPAEAKWVSPEFVHDGSELAIAEMLKSGTTCFNDMYFFPDATARAAQTAGIRACIGLILIDFPSAWAGNADEYLHKGLQLHDALKHSPLITTAFAPHAPYTVADAPLEKVRMYADELDIPIHMHVHETAHEVQQAVAQSGKRPLERLTELGLLGPRLLAVHMTQLTDADIGTLAQANVNVLHCPESNLKLASGTCPVSKLLKAGVNVALGTDGAASNNDLDMLGELRTAALLAKSAAFDPTVVPAHTALRLATLNGARALGLDAHIGSLVAGKSADITAIDLSALSTQPVYEPLSQIVYSVARDQVTDVWVAGKRLLANRTLTTLDENAIRRRTQEWRDKIKITNKQN
ncbi:MAG TPA: TRZ/ATZ family hydrolase [Burkholderiales bacterium]|nr:TRZ/ATZ family hydrolase [Burkholderiales bacterium]